MSMQVANTILKQLGGNRFVAMTGAKDFVGSKDALSMSLPSIARHDGARINKLRVTLDADDTYTVAVFFYSRRTLTCDEVASISGIYADRLQAVFSSMTGLATRL